MTIECHPKIEKLLKSYYGDDFRLDMNLVSLEKTENGGDLESEFYRVTITGDKKIIDAFIGAHEKPYSK